ncbi:MAG: bacteriochlorophyll 4-vinyl reductase, partial [Gemmobacter sp.]
HVPDARGRHRAVARDRAMTAPAASGLIGPNSAIQLAAALEAMGEGAVARAAFAAAGREGWLAVPPTAMIPEGDAARLFAEVWQRLPAARAAALLEDAGRRTGAYILRHRIPPLAQAALRLMPQRMAALMLRRAIHNAAWTFAGSGRCAVSRGVPGARYGRIAIAGNPLRLPGAPWHRGVFTALFAALVDPRVTVTADCPAPGCAGCQAAACRFRLDRS